MRWWQRRDDPHVGLQGFLEMLCVEDISKFTAAHDQNHHEINDDPCRPHACVSQNWYPSLNDPNLALMRLITKVCNKNPALRMLPTWWILYCVSFLWVEHQKSLTRVQVTESISLFFNLKQLPAQNGIEAARRWITLQPGAGYEIIVRKKLDGIAKKLGREKSRRNWWRFSLDLLVNCSHSIQECWWDCCK